MVTPGNLARRAAFFEQLAATISAGVPLTRAIEMAGRSRSSGVPLRVVNVLIQYLHEGHTFTDAMQMVSGQKRGVDAVLKPSRSYWLSDFDIALLSAGEESGRLDIAFRTLARYYATRAKIIRDTIAGMLVTLATLHVFLLICPLDYLIGFVKGIIDGDPSQCAPFLIEKVVAFGSLYGIVFFFILACQGNRGEKWRTLVENVFGIVPILRTALKYLALARLASALEALTNAGVPVVRSWELAAVASGSQKLKRHLSQWIPHLETGTTPAEMVNQIRYFPEMFQNLYNTAEVSGKLDETLVRLNSYFEQEGFRILQNFTRLFNAVIYCIVAGFVIHFIFSFYIGRFKQMDSILNGF